jgi:glutamine synthetase adenylyltransferase
LFIFKNEKDAMSVADNFAKRFLETLRAEAGHAPLYDTNDGVNFWDGPGPLVTSLDELIELCAGESGGSQFFAMMQARVVAGAPTFAQEVSRTVKDLVGPGEETMLLGSYAADGRGEGSEGQEAPRKWDMRRRRGGLDDLDAIVRRLQLRHGSEHPVVLTPSIAGALANFADVGLLDDALVRDLLVVHYLLRQVENVLAIAVDDRLDADNATKELKANLSRAAGLENFDRLQPALNDGFEFVQTTFQDLVGVVGGTAR